MFDMKGLYVSAGGTIQGHHGPLVCSKNIRDISKNNNNKKNHG